jgi:hypothetical protein
VSGYELCIEIGLILVSHIHTDLVLVVGINNDCYIKLFLVISRKKYGICSTCIGTLVVWITGKNNLTQCITHREAVFAPVINGIFDGWHYDVPGTCELTRLL